MRKNEKIWEKLKIQRFLCLFLISAFIITQCTQVSGADAGAQFEDELSFDDTLEDGESFLEEQIIEEVSESVELDVFAETLDEEIQTQAVEADGSVEINEVNFPDEQFRAYVSTAEIDQDQDRILSSQELEAVTEINVSGTSTSNRYLAENLTGIEYFTKLKNLYCSYGNLKSLDLSKNTELEVLEAHFNQLQSLNLSGLAKLQKVFAQQNQLTELDVSTCTAITSLDCDNNALKQLDIRNNGYLEYFACYSNQLTSLDVSNHPQLKVLTCHRNQLTTLDVSANTALQTLQCERNQLTKLTGVENLTLLTTFDGSGQTHTALKMSHGETQWIDAGGGSFLSSQISFYSDPEMTVKLESFRINSTGIVIATTPLMNADTIYFKQDITDGKGEVRTLSGSAEYSLPTEICYMDQSVASTLGADVNDLATYFQTNIGNVTPTVVCNDYENVRNGVKGSYPVTLTYGNISLQMTLEVGIEINGTNFPDEYFRNFVSSTEIDQDGNGFLTLAELQAVTQINISGTSLSNRHSVKDLTGIEHFSKLQRLYCNYGDLEALDVSKNKELVRIEAAHNQLLNVTLGELPKLSDIIIQRNQLKSIDVSKCTALGNFDCDYNELTEIDVSNNPKLTYFACYGNKLTELDISSHPQLTLLTCHNNQLTNLDVSVNTNLRTLSCGGNALTRLIGFENLTNLTDFDAAGQKPKALSMTYAKNVWEDESGCVYISGTDTTFYSDEEMQNALTAFSVNANGKVTASSVLPLTDPVYFRSQITDGSGTVRIISGKAGFDATGTLTADTYYMDKREAKSLSANVNDLAQFFATNVGNHVQAVVTCAEYETIRKGTAGSYSLKICYGNITFEATLEVGVRIDAVNFPDEAFRTYVLGTTIDQDQDQFLTYSELMSVTVLDISGIEGIPIYDSHPYGDSANRHTYKDLTGIEHFEQLQELYCKWGYLETVDLRQNQELKKIDLRFNSLTSLDLSGLEKLTAISVQRNDLDSLKLTGCSALSNLDCDYNQRLAALDLKDCTELVYFACYNCALTELDTSHLQKIVQIWCYDNQLSELDVSANTTLKRLKCSNNELTELDLENNRALNSLYCSGNALKDLDLTYNTALTELGCSDNALTQLQVNHLTSLKNLECDGNHLTSLDISNLPTNLTVDAEGQTVQKDLAMSYSDGAWKNVAVTGLEPVRTFHKNGTTFYEYDATNHTAGSNQLTAFSVNSSGVLTASKVFAVVDPVYFTTTLYDSTGAARSGKLTGMFTYAPQFTLSGATLFYSSAELQKELQKANITDEAGLKNLTGSFGASPDLTEIKDAVTVKLTSGSFTDLAAGTKGVYTYQVRLGSTSATGKIVVYGDDETAMQQLVVIPATIRLNRNFTDNYAEAEETVKLVTTAGNIMEDTSKVKVTADASFDLQLGASTTEKLSVDVYTVDSSGNANAYTGTTPLAELDKTNKTEQKFQLRSANVRNLTYGEYQGTMKFTISYME